MKPSDFMLWKMLLIICIGFSGLAFAESGGTLNFSTSNVSVTSGLFGHTVNFCNNNDNCFQYKCFLDYDGQSATGYAGWCNQTSVTSCYKNVSSTNGASNPVATGTSYCTNSVNYRTCTNGVWGSEITCGSNQTCSSGSCSTTSSSSSSSSGGSSGTSGTTSNTSVKKFEISIIFLPTSFDIIQGGSTSKTIKVMNSGNFTLSDVRITLSNAEWITLTPASISSLAKTVEYTFSIDINIPETADVKTYTIDVTVLTNYTNVSAAGKFSFNVIPTNKTIETFLPRYENYIALYNNYTKIADELAKKGVNVDEIAGFLENAQLKLEKAKAAMDSGKYFDAKLLLDDAESLLKGANDRLVSIQNPLDIVLIIIIIAVIIVIGFVGYMMLPAKAAKPKINFG